MYIYIYASFVCTYIKTHRPDSEALIKKSPWHGPLGSRAPARPAAPAARRRAAEVPARSPGRSRGAVAGRSPGWVGGPGSPGREVLTRSRMAIIHIYVFSY